MIRTCAIALASALFATACSGGGGSPGVVHAAAGQGAQPLVTTAFVFSVPSTTPASQRSPKYLTANVASVQIALDTVNGAAPPASLTASVTTNITLASCPCTVAGPAVPPGSDAFTLTSYDAQNGGGHVVSTAAPTLTIVAGQANSNTITLNGVPASLSIVLPGGTAGTAFAATAFSVTVKDVDGNTIMGTYENPVTLVDSDPSSATTLATSGSDSPPAGQLVSSSDVAKLSYSGLAIAPITIAGSASGATTGNGSFAPALQPIVTTAPLNGATPEIALTQSTSSGAFTASEVGWTNAPYNKSLTATQGSGCGTIGTTAPPSGTVFTTTVAGSPLAATCTLTLNDFSGGSTLAVSLAYVTGSQLFSYNGAQQNFSVPFGVSQVTLAVAGAAGGTANSGATAAGNGGSLTATIPVTAGTSLAVFVGGAGGAGTGSIGGAGGFNGGAAGGNVFFTGGGGGASGISAAGTPLVVAGGGGGGGLSASTGSTGGDGGGTTAAAGVAGNFGGGGGGGGGTGATGGTGGAGTGTGAAGSPGSAGTGGAGSGGCTHPGGGGGGGYFGGGGGGCSSVGYGGGGGGGSSYVEPTAIGTPTIIQGGQTGNGTITIAW